MNENTMNALQHWMGPDWWPRNDDDKFYLFVFAVWEEFGKMWDEKETRRIMEEEAAELHPDFDKTFCADTIERYHSRATVILDFLAHIKFEGKTLVIGGKR
jgi:hypothetical protein